MVFAAIAGGLVVDWRLGGTGGSLGLIVAIVGFMALAVLQNLWRPMHIGRFDTHGEAKSGATLLSIESQAKTLSAMIFYPLLGLAVDAFGRWGGFYAGRAEEACAAPKFLPAAIAGIAFAAMVLMVFRRPIPAPPAHAGDDGGDGV